MYCTLECVYYAGGALGAIFIFFWWRTVTPMHNLFETSLRTVSPRVRVYWVASGKEALEFLHQKGRFEKIGDVQIIVLDMNLGDDSGVNVLRDIKSDPDL